MAINVYGIPCTDS